MRIRKYNSMQIVWEREMHVRIRWFRCNDFQIYVDMDYDFYIEHEHKWLVVGGK